MDSYMTIPEAAALWGCSERSAQMLCKQGRVPGAQKVSGIWLLPMDAVHPRTGQPEVLPPFQPERLYGRNTTVRISPVPGKKDAEECGCIVTQYQIFDGISLVFQDIHEEKLDYGDTPPRLPTDLIAIQHCREGRFEGAYPNGECIYMGPGNVSVNLPAWAPVSNSFPLRHYHGLYLAILPRIAEASIQKLEQVLGPMHIDFSVLAERLSLRNKLALFTVDETMAQVLAAIYPKQGEVREAHLKLRVLELLQLLCTQEIPLSSPEQYFPREQVRTIKEIRQYLISHLDQHIPLQELAAQFRISLTGMKTCFKGVYGQSIGKYLRDFRMQSGAEQLANADCRIIDIAAALGYKNASKFSEAFAEYYGMSPTKYRKTFCPSGGLPDGEE